MAKYDVTPKVWGREAGTGDLTLLPYDYVDPNPISGGPAITWTGAYPFLDTADGYGSAGVSHYPYFLAGILPPTTPPGEVLVEYQILKTGVSSLDVSIRDSNDFTVALHYVEMPADYATEGTTYPRNEWITDRYAVPATPEVKDALAGGRFTVVFHQADSLYVSMLHVIDDTIPPLRQIQRDDGLLRSARRARGGRSRQGSLRQRGYL